MNEINKEFFLAVKNNDLKKITALIENGADINTEDSTGKTPLINACGNGFTEIAKLLIEKKANINAIENEIKATPLTAASVGCYLDIMRILIENGADVNHKSKDDFTALMYCSHKGSYEAVKLLIKNGSVINALNIYGESALLKACYSGSLKIVKLLLEKGADINLQSKEHGLTPLMLAADNNHLQIVKFLLEKGAKKNLTSIGLRTAYDYARLKGFKEIEELLKPKTNEIPEKIKKTKKKYSDNEIKKSNIMLIDAIWDNNMNYVISAIENGADINSNSADYYPIILAASNGYIGIVQLLINEGADVNVKDTTDMSALGKACGACYAEIAKLLIANGATVNNDVIIAASIHKNPDIMNLLQKAQTLQSKPNIKNTNESINIITAASNGDLESVKKVLEGGADINAKDDDGGTAILWASRKGYTDIVKFLIEKNADVNAASEYKWTALMEASLNGHFEIVKLLIEHGADINAETSVGATSLIFSCAEGHINVVKFLLEKGAKTDQKIFEGQNKDMTAYRFACRKGHMDIVAILEKIIKKDGG